MKEECELSKLISLHRHLLNYRDKGTVASPNFCQCQEVKAQEVIVNEFKSIESLPGIFNWIICTQVHIITSSMGVSLVYRLYFFLFVLLSLWLFQTTLSSVW